MYCLRLTRLTRLCIGIEEKMMCGVNVYTNFCISTTGKKRGFRFIINILVLKYTCVRITKFHLTLRLSNISKPELYDTRCCSMRDKYLTTIKKQCVQKKHFSFYVLYIRRIYIGTHIYIIQVFDVYDFNYI